MKENYNIDTDACKEVYVILTKLNLFNRVPEEMWAYIKENQNKEYEFDFNEKALLFYQVENDETKALLTYLFIKYINTHEKDIKLCKEKIMDIIKKVE